MRTFREVKSRMRSQSGQSGTEYMLVVSVVVVAVVAGAYAFLPSFNAGVQELSMDVSQILDDHGSTKGGFGLAAADAAGGGAGTVRGSGFGGDSSGHAGSLGAPNGTAVDYGSGE